MNIFRIISKDYDRKYKRRIRNINGMNTQDIMDKLIIQNIEYRIRSIY
jgi:hypothetical protein